MLYLSQIPGYGEVSQVVELTPSSKPNFLNFINQGRGVADNLTILTKEADMMVHTPDDDRYGPQRCFMWSFQTTPLV